MWVNKRAKYSSGAEVHLKWKPNQSGGSQRPDKCAERETNLTPKLYYDWGKPIDFRRALAIERGHDRSVQQSMDRDHFGPWTIRERDGRESAWKTPSRAKRNAEEFKRFFSPTKTCRRKYQRSLQIIAADKR